MCRAIATSTITALGMRNRITALFGIRILWMPVGLPTATATGTTSGRGDGLGLAMSPGDLLRSTMDVGLSSVADGAGARVLFMRGQFMARLLWDFSAADFDLALAVESAGSRSVFANRSV